MYTQRPDCGAVESASSMPVATHSSFLVSPGTRLLALLFPKFHVCFSIFLAYFVSLSLFCYYFEFIKKSNKTDRAKFCDTARGEDSSGTFFFLETFPFVIVSIAGAIAMTSTTVTYYHPLFYAACGYIFYNYCPSTAIALFSALAFFLSLLGCCVLCVCVGVCVWGVCVCVCVCVLLSCCVGVAARRHRIVNSSSTKSLRLMYTFFPPPAGGFAATVRQHSSSTRK